MTWLKLGRIFNPEVISGQGLSYALMPIVETLDAQNDLVRVYYSPRDAFRRSQLRYFEIDMKAPSEILRMADKPLIEAGIIGAFDDSGITPGSFCNVGGKKAFFYTGWNLTVSVPMNNSIGISFYDAHEGIFKRIGHGPIMTRTLHEPFSCASPFVMHDPKKGIYWMWYASMDSWKIQGEEKVHFYNIKVATSLDGINWQREAKVAIDYTHTGEYAFGRPFVMLEDNIYKMWFAVRGESYRIGYAESVDGWTWTRKDEILNIQLSSEGWDSEMMEYPFIFDLKNKRYMFYNGNGYGASGIGLAVWEHN